MHTTKRKPTSPGEILSEEFLKPLGITQTELARHIDCDVKVINRIVNGASSLTADMAVKLGAALNTTPDFWMTLQAAVSLFEAEARVQRPKVHEKVLAHA